MQGGQRRVGEHACEAPGELDQGQSCEPAQDELSSRCWGLWIRTRTRLQHSERTVRLQGVEGMV